MMGGRSGESGKGVQEKAPLLQVYTINSKFCVNFSCFAIG